MKYGSGRATVSPCGLSQTSGEALNSGMSPHERTPQCVIVFYFTWTADVSGDIGSLFLCAKRKIVKEKNESVRKSREIVEVS